MTDRKGLLRAIIEHPDDDAPRLVYADWLDETGDPDQAEYIRVRCALDSPATPDDRRRACEQRAKSLTPWQPPALGGITWGNYDRGYPRQITAVGWAALRAAWDTIFSVAPVVWVIVPERTLAHLDEFLARPETRLLQYVFMSFDDPLDRVAKKLAAAEATDGWIDLVLEADRENYLTDRGADAFLTARHLRRLASLSCVCGDVSPDRRAALDRWTAARVV